MVTQSKPRVYADQQCLVSERALVKVVQISREVQLEDMCRKVRAEAEQKIRDAEAQ